MLHEMVASTCVIRAFRVEGNARTELGLHLGPAPYRALCPLIPSAAQRAFANAVTDFETLSNLCKIAQLIDERADI